MKHPKGVMAACSALAAPSSVSLNNQAMCRLLWYLDNVSLVRCEDPLAAFDPLKLSLLDER